MVNHKKIEQAKLALLSLQRRCWEQGEAVQAMLELRDYEKMISLAREAVYISLDDGRTAVVTDLDASTVTDSCACGEGLMRAYHLTGDSCFKNSADKMLEYIRFQAPRSKAGIIYHLTDKSEFWVDSMYMLPPFLAVMGMHQEAVKQLNGYWDALFDPKDKLLRWIWDDEKKLFNQCLYRGIGNGYGILGMVRVIGILPKEMQKEKEDLIDKTKIIINSMLPYIDDNAICHVTLNDSSSFIAINGVSMLVAGIFRGLQMGWLEEIYLKIANKLRNALFSKIDDYGYLYGVSGAPSLTQTGKKTGVSPNGQSFFLLMEAAYRDYQVSNSH